MRRVRRLVSSIELIYLARVPAAAYQDSCIFHGKRGCTLDRSMRADICNTYFLRRPSSIHEKPH